MKEVKVWEGDEKNIGPLSGIGLFRRLEYLADQADLSVGAYFCYGTCVPSI